MTACGEPADAHVLPEPGSERGAGRAPDPAASGERGGFLASGGRGAAAQTSLAGQSSSRAPITAVCRV